MLQAFQGRSGFAVGCRINSWANWSNAMLLLFTDSKGKVLLCVCQAFASHACSWRVRVVMQPTETK